LSKFSHPRAIFLPSLFHRQEEEKIASMEKIDDRDNSVVYSQPLLGSDWSNWGDPNDYQGTASLTRTEGANAQVTFNGESALRRLLSLFPSPDVEINF
jgi:hypothetical protein